MVLATSFGPVVGDGVGWRGEGSSLSVGPCSEHAEVRDAGCSLGAKLQEDPPSGPKDASRKRAGKVAAFFRCPEPYSEQAPFLERLVPSVCSCPRGAIRILQTR